MVKLNVLLLFILIVKLNQ